jgi:hypothetical protein
MERRKYLRVTVDLPSQILGEWDADVVGKCYSLGGGGFGFLLPRPFDVGEWLTVEIEVGSDRVNARAVVVGCANAEDPKDEWRVSCRLEELPREDFERLHDVLLHPVG